MKRRHKIPAVSVYIRLRAFQFHKQHPFFHSLSVSSQFTSRGHTGTGINWGSIYFELSKNFGAYIPYNVTPGKLIEVRYLLDWFCIMFEDLTSANASFEFNI